MNQKFIRLFLVMCLCALIPFAVAADIDMENPDAETVISQIKQEITLDMDEMQEKGLLRVLEESAMVCALLTGDADENTPEATMLLDGNYRLFTFTEPDMIRAYQERGNLATLISEDYQIYVPVSNGGDICLHNDGVWEVIGTSRPMLPDYVPAFSTDAVVRSLQSHYQGQPSAVISDLKIVRSHVHYITFAYYTETGREYVIPFSDRPDFTGLEDGKVYPVSEIMNILDERFPVQQNPYADGGAGGYSGVDTQQGLPWQLLPALALLLLAGIAILVLCKAKSRRYPKNQL